MRAQVLGLALAKAFVEWHGGVITVDSVEGKGTVFTVDIPMEIVEEQSVDSDTGTAHYTADGGGGVGGNGNRRADSG